MNKLDDDFKIPIELQGNDVYDMFYLFDNEEEMLKYVFSNYEINKDEFIYELHEEDKLREEYGKENFLRSAQINLMLYVNELTDGKYILWEAY